MVLHDAERAARIPERPPKPFLKWAGGKGRLLEQFAPLLPKKYVRYFEPFLGGGALFFGLRPKKARLSDVNAELVDCYTAVRDDVDSLIAELKRHRYEKNHFYRVRALDPRSLALPARAARTIFLNKTAFNGLYRVNSSGQFNVPFGRHRDPQFCDEDNLRACSRALRKVELIVSDFTDVLKKSNEGDFVYFDPPYVPVSKTAYFTAYAPGGFDWPDQQRLAEVFVELDRMGVQVMLSNSDVPALRKLYAGYRLDCVAAARAINSKVEGRGKIAELVVRNYG